MRRRAKRRKTGSRRTSDIADRGQIVDLAERLARHPETTPALTGGDMDADWLRAHHAGDEAVGGSVATPDQDVVDEIGRALGVERPPDAEVQTSDDLLLARDRLRWHLERDEADEAEGRSRPRRRGRG